MSLDETAPESAELGASVAGLRVLVAEDTPITQAMMRMRLTKMGCEVSVVDNGRDAVTAVKARSFDCILMDYHMPVLDGADATKEIRAWEEAEQKKPGVYIAAFTATSQSNDRGLLMAAGMDDILVKPMVVTELIAILHRAAARR